MHVCCSLSRRREEDSVRCDSGRSPTRTRSRCTRPPPTARWSDTLSPGGGTTPSTLRGKTKAKQDEGTETNREHRGVGRGENEFEPSQS